MIISTTARVDLIRIRKYASPEPSASVGSEETPNSSLASPTSPTQLENDESTVISNQGYTNETNVKLKASATDSDNPEVITLFFEAALNSGAFSSPATPTTGGSCASGTEWSFCGDKIWYVTSASGDYSSTPYTGITNVAGLSDAAAYKWQVKACDDNSACSSWVAYNATTPNFTVDTSPPTNVGVSSITADSTTQLTITSQTATDATSGLHATPYWFNETTGNAGATDSVAWQTSTDFVDDGLSPNTQYTYQVKAKDAVENESSYSASVSKYTLANIPAAPTVDGATASSLNITIDQNSNPSNTVYAIYETTTSKYVDSTDGSLDLASEDWQDYTAWGGASGIAVTPLSENTTYTFQVKARNGDNIETNYTSSASVETNGCGGGGMPPGTSNPPSQPELTPENPESGFSVSINNGDEYTSSEIVTLKLNAGADTTKMAISNTEDFEYASQIDYQEEIEWELLENPPSPLLQKGNICTVYAKFYTQYGVASEMVSDSIILDTQAPEEVKNLLEMLISKICK